MKTKTGTKPTKKAISLNYLNIQVDVAKHVFCSDGFRKDYPLNECAHDAFECARHFTMELKRRISVGLLKP